MWAAVFEERPIIRIRIRFSIGVEFDFLSERRTKV
jgi:hypothetical protein